MTASPPAAPGMPSEEEIVGAIANEIFEGGYVDAPAAARAVLSLIRPVFERAEADAKIFRINATSKLRSLEARALSAEAKLAQAVEALSRAKDEIVRTADDLSMHSPAVNLVEEIATIIGQPALNSRAIVRDAASAAARGETT